MSVLLVQPSADMSVFIRKELREPDSPADIDKDVATIREWLDKQPHLPKDMGKCIAPMLLIFKTYHNFFRRSKTTNLFERL